MCMCCVPCSLITSVKLRSALISNSSQWNLPFLIAQDTPGLNFKALFSALLSYNIKITPTMCATLYRFQVHLQPYPKFTPTSTL